MLPSARTVLKLSGSVGKRSTFMVQHPRDRFPLLQPTKKHLVSLSSSVIFGELFSLAGSLLEDEWPLQTPPSLVRRKTLLRTGRRMGRNSECWQLGRYFIRCCYTKHVLWHFLDTELLQMPLRHWTELISFFFSMQEKSKACSMNEWIFVLEREIIESFAFSMSHRQHGERSDCSLPLLTSNQNKWMKSRWYI